MPIITRLCKWVAGHMNLHAIPDRTDPNDTYLARYHATDKQEDARWFLHNIKRADYEEFAHDHPYRWQYSFILSGSYDEEYFDIQDKHDPEAFGVTRRRRVRWFNRIPSSRYHRITKLHGDVWTVFVHGPKHGNSWGFWWPQIGHVHNELMEKYWQWQRRTQEQRFVSSLPH